ncbi:MAG: tetratricopeptide repeat protein [Cyanobacteria bacterium P01_A01_bin.105]
MRDKTDMSRNIHLQPLLTAALLGLTAMGVYPSQAQAQTALPPIQSNAQLPQSVQTGYQRLDEGRVDDAISLFEQALQSNPDQLEATLGLAIAYGRAGRDADAFATYQRVVGLDPNNVTALTGLGVLGGFRPEWQQTGIEALTQLLTLQPNNLDALSQRALLLFYQGQFGGAMADYERVLTQPPVTDSALIGAAQVYAYGGRSGEAIDLFEQYERRGQDLTGYEAMAYAFALRQLGEAPAAIAVLQPQLEDIEPIPAAADPLQLQLRSALAAAYAANGQTTTALAILDPLQGRPDAQLSLARALSDIARYSEDEAIAAESARVYQQVLADPDLTVGTAREVAEALSAYPDQQATTLAIYQQLAAQNPGDLSLSVQKTVWERRLGEISATELRQRLQPLASNLPEDPAQLRSLAQALVQLDPPDAELFDLYAALSERTRVDFLDFRLAQIYLEGQQPAPARQVLSRYADAETADEATLFLLLAEVERQEGNLASSEARYQLLIDQYPEQTDIQVGALQGLAGLREGEGRIEEALALYDQVLTLSDDLAKPLGRASIAYRGGVISEAAATAVLNQWLATQPADSTPPELFSLVASLPPDSGRISLYDRLLVVNPRNLPVRLRQIQAIAQQDPAAAQALAAAVVAANPASFEGYLLQGQIAQDVGDLDTASQAYQAILTLDPAQPDALIALGGVRFAQRRYQAARGLYDQALAIVPDNLGLRQASASLTAALDRPIAALQELETLQVDLAAAGYPSAAIAQERRRIREGMLRQRGFQPEWERY